MFSRVQARHDDERGMTMNSMTAGWRQRRQAARTRRAIDEALMGVSLLPR